MDKNVKGRLKSQLTVINQKIKELELIKLYIRVSKQNTSPISWACFNLLVFTNKKKRSARSIATAWTAKIYRTFSIMQCNSILFKTVSNRISTICCRESPTTRFSSRCMAVRRSVTASSTSFLSSTATCSPLLSSLSSLGTISTKHLPCNYNINKIAVTNLRTGKKIAG